MKSFYCKKGSINVTIANVFSTISSTEGLESSIVAGYFIGNAIFISSCENCLYENFVIFPASLYH